MTYTVRSWMETWMEEYQKGDARPSTCEAKVYILKNHIYPCIGDIPLDELTSEKVGEFLEDRRLYGNHRKNSKIYPRLGPCAMRNIHRLLQQSLDQAMQNGVIDENPARAFKYQKPKNVTLDPMTKDEAEQYLKAAEELGYIAMFDLALNSGISQGELIALKWSDLNVDTRMLTIHEGRTYSCRNLIEYEGKIREIPLLPRTVLLLCREHDRHPSSPYMFIHPGTLNPLSPNMVRARHKQIIQHAELPHIRFEDLRHTFAVLALEQGMKVDQLSKILGHSRPITTRNHYEEFIPYKPALNSDTRKRDKEVIRVSSKLSFTVKTK